MQSSGRLFRAPYVVPIIMASVCNFLANSSAVAQPMQAGVEEESGPKNVLFLLDCSYSMKEKLSGGEMKINEAKMVLQEALARVPNDVNIGLRIFGQGYSQIPDVDCRQSALLVPIGQHNRGAIRNAIGNIKPFGMTPLTYAIALAAEDDFRDVQGAKTLIVISDGADTCGGDPCRYVATLRQRGIRLKVDVVGVDLKRDAAARNQLNCISITSGGKYYKADTATELVDSVTKSIDTAISGKVIIKEKTDQIPDQSAPKLP